MHRVQDPSLDPDHSERNMDKQTTPQLPSFRSLLAEESEALTLLMLIGKLTKRIQTKPPLPLPSILLPPFSNCLILLGSEDICGKSSRLANLTISYSCRLKRFRRIQWYYYFYRQAFQKGWKLEALSVSKSTSHRLTGGEGRGDFGLPSISICRQDYCV
jgi:hypothetical protein